MNKEVFSINFIRGSFCFFLSLVSQFIIGSFIWSLCNNIDYFHEEKKLNLSLIVPIEEQQIQEPQKEILHMEEIEDNEIKPVEMTLDKILPVDPFEETRLMEEPVIPKPEPAPIKKKKEIRKEAPKIVKPELKEVAVESVKPQQETVIETKQVSIQEPVKVEEKKQVPKTVSKPVLTKSQMNENSKYLSKVMKIFEKNKVYPSNARAMHIEGKIIVSFCIDKDGKTNNVSAKTKNPKILATAAEELVRNSRLPAPPSHWDVSAKIELPITYKLR